MFRRGYVNLFLLLAVGLQAGCASQMDRQAVDIDPYTVKKFSAPVGVRLETNTGDSLFVEGTFIEGEVIFLPSSVSLMIPGSLNIPFPVKLEEGELTLTKISNDWKYYCARFDKATATFPGLGSVVRDGDCIGIRISLRSGEEQWVVDNSVYNGMATIYEKRMNDDDLTRYSPKLTSEPFQIREIKRLVFDGYYGGQLHFTFEEVSKGDSHSREFTFDYSGGNTRIGMLGHELTVLDVNNVRLIYQWENSVDH